MSVITYNGIKLPYGYTSQFTQEAVYDDMGQTDWCYVKFDIQVQTIICSDYLVSLFPNIAGQTTNPAAIMSVVRGRLLTPRKTLSFKFGDVELIPQKVAGLPGTVDARNGPQPQSCNLMQLSDTTFLLTYHVIAYYWEGNTISLSSSGNGVPQAPDAGNPVLFNRWSETIDIDGANYTTRTRDGKFVIRSDNNQGLVADQLRLQMAVVGVPPGFLRRSSSYKVSPDGLAIEYRVVDYEVFKTPPIPAFRASGEYTESACRWMAKRYCEVNCDLEGSKTTKQADLITTAVAVCLRKLALNGAAIVVPPAGGAGGGGGGGGGGNLVAVAGAPGVGAFVTGASTGGIIGGIAFGLGSLIGDFVVGIFTGGGGGTAGTPASTVPPAYLETAIIRVDMYENKVSVRMRALAGPRTTLDGKGRTGDVAGVRWAGMTETPFSDNLAVGAIGGVGAGAFLPVQPNYLDRGTAQRMLQAAAYYDPSITSTAINRTLGQLNRGLEPGQAGKDEET